MKTLLRYGGQYLAEIIHDKRQDRIWFKPVGDFAAGFSNRRILDNSLKWRGIGTAALNSFLAAQRNAKATAVTLESRKKSMLRLLLRNGFVVDENKSKKALSALRLGGQEGLAEYVSRPETPEDLTWLTNRNYFVLTRQLRLRKE